MPVSKDHYYRLASNLPNERISAASALISELSSANSIDDYSYALKRLISGLASNNDSARLGFSMCLTELLSLLSNNEIYPYNASQFLQSLNSSLDSSIKNKQKGKNLRCYLFGKLFGLQSLINSNLLGKDDIDLHISIINQLFEIALAKSWIREIAIVTIIKFIQSYNLISNDSIIPLIISKLASNNLLISMDSVLLYINIPSNLRKLMTEKANIDSSIIRWKNDDPLTKGNLPLLKDALQDRIIDNNSNDDENENNNKDNKIQKGSWTAQLHYVWVPLLNELIENELSLNDETTHISKKQKNSSKKSKNNNNNNNNQLTLSTFWPTFDSTFFSNSSSSERKHTGLQILELIIKLPSFIPQFYLIIFSENLTRCFINHLSKNDRMLHTLSIKILQSIIKSIELKPLNRLYLIKALTRQCLLFDKLSKSKIIKSSLSNLNNGIDKVDMDTINDKIEEFEKITNWLINDASDELKSSNNLLNDIQTFILDSLLNLIRGNKRFINSIINSNDKTLILPLVSSIKSILEYLTNIIFIKDSSNVYNESIIKLSNERLQSILSDLMDICKTQIDWSGMIVTKLNTYNDEELLNKLDSENNELIEIKSNSLKIWEKINNSVQNNECKSINLNKCLVMLFSIALLELYSGESESFSILSDLINMYEDIENSESDESDDNVLNTLVDLLLSYLTQKSSLKKRIGNNIWECIVHEIKQEQLDRLFDVLLTKENKKGMEELFNQEVDGYDEEGDEEDDEKKLSEDSEEEDDDEDEEEEEEEDNDGEESDEESDENSKIEEVEKSATSALAKALNVAESSADDTNKNVDASSDDDEDDDDDHDDDHDDDEGIESDSSVESMSDEQMMAIDNQLSAIFQQRQNSLNELKSSSKNGNERKLEAKEARDLMSLCKLRILDLLEIYVNINSTNFEVISIALTNLDLMNLTLDIKVGEKAHKLIKKICKHPFSIGENDDEETDKEIEIDHLIDLIRQVLERASKSKFNALNNACSQVSIYIIRSILNKIDDDDEKYEDYLTKITNVYQTEMVKWAISKNNKISSTLFIDLINWLNSKRINKQ